MSTLIVTINGSKDDEIHVQHGTMTIGRNKENDIRLNDSTVSAQHAKIVTFFEPTFIQDQNSTNGTYVNDKRVLKQTLRNGDVITIGKYQLVFNFSKDDTIIHDNENTQILNSGEIEELLKNASGENIRAIADKNLIPDNVHWVAQDTDGMWWGFLNKPDESTQGWVTTKNDPRHQLLQCSPNTEWKKTLRKL